MLCSTWSPQVLTWIWRTRLVESYIISVLNILLVVYRVSHLAFIFCEKEGRGVRLWKNSCSTQGKDKKSSVINYNQTHGLSIFLNGKKNIYLLHWSNLPTPLKSQETRPYSMLAALSWLTALPQPPPPPPPPYARIVIRFNYVIRLKLETCWEYLLAHNLWKNCTIILDDIVMMQFLTYDNWYLTLLVFQFIFLKGKVAMSTTSLKCRDGLFYRTLKITNIQE